MDNNVSFRDFEERDIDFVYKCKNDPKLNKLIVGQYHPFTYEEAITWVHGCMGEHETFKFWAVCTNDEEKRIVGWIGLSDIDIVNRSACFHSIVIGDKDYQDGFAWIESYLFIFKIVFEDFKLHRMYGSHITMHNKSESIARAMGIVNEGIQRDALYKDGVFYDISIDSILSNEYFTHKADGDYSMKLIVKRILKAKK